MTSLAGVPMPDPPGAPFNPMIDLPDLPHAWSTPYLWAFDSIRVLLILVCLYLVYLLAYAAVLSRAQAQRAMTLAFLLAVLLSVWTQVERIGRPVSWRLPVVGLMVYLGVGGALRYMTGGRRLREFSLRSYLVPPVPPHVDPTPAELQARMRATHAAAPPHTATGATKRADGEDTKPGEGP